MLIGRIVEPDTAVGVIFELVLKDRVRVAGADRVYMEAVVVVVRERVLVEVVIARPIAEFDPVSRVVGYGIMVNRVMA